MRRSFGTRARLPFLYIGGLNRPHRPILVVSDVAARLVRRGLIDPTDPTLPRWRETRVLVFADGPVVAYVTARHGLPVSVAALQHADPPR